VNTSIRASLILLTLLLGPRSVAAAPQVLQQPQQLVVTAQAYRITFHRYRSEFRLELRGDRGQWLAVTKPRTQPEFAVVDAQGVHTSLDSPARLRHVIAGEAVVVGLTTVLPSSPPTIARIHFVCTDDGLLVQFAPQGQSGEVTPACWAMPRLTLDEKVFATYAYWAASDELRSGRIADLGVPTCYAGVSPWGRQGDTAARLSARHPAVLARSESTSLALGVVFLDYEARWPRAHSFLQAYSRDQLYFYPAIGGDGSSTNGAWAWLAPMPAGLSAAGQKVERLLDAGKALVAGFEPIAPEPDVQWTEPQPDFPAALRRPQPIEDIRRAMVYTINETIQTDDGLDLARKTGSDVLIRGWFKWGTPPDYARLAPQVAQAHAMGALFGGGITCSALYHGENGLTDEQVLDMATRGPEGQLVNAWNEPRCRHGTLSNPAYLDYLLASCRRQIDAGADYLFMDEINAALQADEGFDDYSIADFRRFLWERYGQQGWRATDARWHEILKIDLANKDVAPGGTMETFQYRAYLKSRRLSENPHAAANPLAADWHAFREQRDDRAWKWLTDAIRAHAAARGRCVLISGNGLARYVDLQVLGVWEQWRTAEGRIDLAESQIEQWASTAVAGWSLAGRRVPVVFFHDWGFQGFPWLEVPPEDRRLWIRVRGAEIYAAGAFFAFPVHGPGGNDCRQDGTLPEIARQSQFYHQHQDLYLDAELLGFDPLESSESGLSLALWRRRSPPSLLLHVINRQTQEGNPTHREAVTVRLPVGHEPRAVRVVSPDWAGEQVGTARAAAGRLTVTLPALEAYSVAILDYEALPDVKLAGRRLVPSGQWGRPARNEFIVQKGGLVADQWALPGMLQGNLHQHLRNPPTFVANMPRGGSLRVHVRGVATLGARLQWLVDGKSEKVLELPDRDGKNEAFAREYDQTYELPIPPGRHRLSLDNVGGDWACIGWYAFAGDTEEP
jgi:hypothetical protein